MIECMIMDLFIQTFDDIHDLLKTEGQHTINASIVIDSKEINDRTNRVLKIYRDPKEKA